jgi:hypothetical protein
MPGRPIRVLLALAVAASAAAPSSAAARVDVSGSATPASVVAPRVPSTPRTAGPRDTGCVIVKYRKTATASARAALGLQDARALPGDRTVLKAAPAGTSAADYAKRLESSPLVEYAEPDTLLAPAYTATPNDPDFADPYTYIGNVDDTTVTVGHGKSWALTGDYSAHFDEVWPTLATAKANGTHIRVAVIDTGFYFDQPDAGANIVAARDECATYSATSGVCTTDTSVEPISLKLADGRARPGTSVDDAAHGTMTASEIAQAPNNVFGSIGAAWDTQVAIYKIQGIVVGSNSALRAGDAVMPTSALMRAIRDAVADTPTGVRLVISMSIEALDSAPSAQLQDAIKFAHDHNAVLVAAAGNSARGSVSYPAAYTYVIGVGACTLNGTRVTRASYSNYGSALDLLAPGTMIWGPTKPGYVGDLSDPDAVPGYTWWNGTSMAAPYVASAAALLLRAEPTLSPAEVESYLERGAVDMGAAGRDGAYGWGRLDAYASYLLLATPQTTAIALPKYEGSATITFSVADRDSRPAGWTTDYWLDDWPVAQGGPVTTSQVGTHTLLYRSVDSNGLTEQTRDLTFTVTPVDLTPPVTSSDATGTYTGVATVHLTATDGDGWGVSQTCYRLDGGTQRSGTSVSVGSLGTHTLTYWSVDNARARNTEASHTATFTVTRAHAAATLSRSASSIRYGYRIRLSGTLSPARKGDSVRIQVRLPGSHTWRYFTGSSKYYWRSVTSVSSSGRGTWSPLSYPLWRHGYYYFRVVFSGDTTSISRTSAVSNAVSVHVR